MKAARPPKKLTEKKLIKSANLFPVVGIGASAGGLDAFKNLIKAIPKDSGMAPMPIGMLVQQFRRSSKYCKR